MEQIQPKKPIFCILLFVILICSCHRHDSDFFSNAEKYSQKDNVILDETDKNMFPDAKSKTIGSELSNQNVTAMAEDADGYIWIGTERGLNRYNAYDYTQYFYNPSDTTSLNSDHITCLNIDSHRRLWIGTDNGIALYTQADNFHRIPCDMQYSAKQIWECPDGRILVNMTERLYQYDPHTDSLITVIRDFDPSKKYYNQCFTDGHIIWSVTEDRVTWYDNKDFRIQKVIHINMHPYYSFMRGRQLILVSKDRAVKMNLSTGAMQDITQLLSSVGGMILQICRYDKQTDVILSDNGLFFYNHIEHNLLRQDGKLLPSTVHEHDITSAFVDSNGNLWLGSHYNGATMIDNHKKRFDDNRFLTNAYSGQPIIALAASGNTVWFMDAWHKLSSYDMLSGKITQMPDTRHRLYPSEYPPDMCIDKSAKLWIMDKGLVYEGNGSKLTQRLDLPPSATCVAMGNDNSIWVGYNKNVLYRKTKNESKFRPIRINIPHIYYLYTMLQLRDGDVILGLALQDPVIVNPLTGKVRAIPTSAYTGRRLKLTTCLFQDKDGCVWIGTAGLGVFRYWPKTGMLQSVKDVSCQEICSIKQDRIGNIWISTMNGLNKYVTTEGFVINYYKEDGIADNRFYEKSADTLSNGDLIFGGTRGITIFNPSFEAKAQTIPFYFEELKLNGKIVKVGNASILHSRLSHTDAITIPYQYHSFSVSFASLGYQKVKQLRYLYKLEGYNTAWVMASGLHECSFTNVPSGNYTLRVKVVDSDNMTDEIERDLRIRIAPAPWNSWWAWTIYIMLAIAALYFSLRVRHRIISQRRVNKKIMEEKEQEERVNKMNMSFFANISHEFRTPLTMISGPVTMLEKSEALSSTEQAFVGTIKLSTTRMLKLVNQLMDFNKLESDALKLQVAETDIIALIRQTIALFTINIQEKHITLKTYGLDGSFMAPVDGDKVDKVVTNLFSNALKFTPVDGNIECGFKVDFGQMMIWVSDDGMQIPEESLDKIFDRYYQVSNPHNYGTGIGLYFSRRLLQLHHGSIRCDNLEGGGVKFTVTLPSDDIYSEEEHAKTCDSDQQKAYPLSPAPVKATSDGQHLHTVLLVDDDSGIISYLKLLLSPKFNVLAAYDADHALSIVRKAVPDLVISDVAMPEKNGYQLCKEIKDDISICHIPVILVTARTTKQDQLTGFGSGADAYITKPFDPDLLVATITSQLQNRERIHKILSNSTSIENIEGKEEINDRDKAFMDELYKIMGEELNNPELNINTLTDALLISRSKLYYKIKGLTGETPNEFFKKYKLNRAAELLRTGNYSVAEVSDMTGFSNQSVFARNFRKQFNVTPTEYMKKV